MFLSIGPMCISRYSYHMLLQVHPTYFIFRSVAIRTGRHVTVYHMIWATKHTHCVIWYGFRKFIEPLNNIGYIINRLTLPYDMIQWIQWMSMDISLELHHCQWLFAAGDYSCITADDYLSIAADVYLSITANDYLLLVTIHALLPMIIHCWWLFIHCCWCLFVHRCQWLLMDHFWWLFVHCWWWLLAHFCQ